MQEPVRGPAVCVECAERTGREGKEDSPCALYLGHIHLRTRRQENIMFQLPSNPFPTGPQLLGFRGVGGVIVPENKLRPVNSKSNSLPPACQSLAGGIFARKRQYERKRSSTEAPGQATGHPRSVHVRFYLSPERPINQARTVPKVHHASLPCPSLSASSRQITSGSARGGRRPPIADGQRRKCGRPLRRAARSADGRPRHEAGRRCCRDCRREGRCDAAQGRASR